jgi:predicted esterase
MRHSSVFFDAGYSTLLIDCREHGTSDAKGLGTGFCVREACDVIHAARFAKTQLGYSKVVACGTSQGAASCIVASVLSEEIEFDALPENVSGGLLRSPSSLRNNNRAIRRSRSRSRSRSYRASMTRQGDAPSDEELELLHASEDDAAATAAAEDEDARAAAVAAAPLIAGVISENAFCSREACVGDVLHTLLGRPPRVLAPVVMPLQTAFVAGAVLLVRYRLGLFQPTRWNQWAYNWRRALGLHESFLDERAASRFATSPSSTAAATTFAPHASPSSAHLPLPPLRAALPPALLRSGASARMLLDLSPLDLVSRISPRPLLLLHGLLDRIIAPAHSQALYTAARDPRRLMLVAEAHHTALIDADREGWTHTVLQWMAQHGF